MPLNSLKIAFLLLIPLISHSQNGSDSKKRVLTYLEFLELLIDDVNLNDSSYYYNKTISDISVVPTQEEEETYQFSKNGSPLSFKKNSFFTKKLEDRGYKIQIDADGRLIIPYSIEFSGCEFLGFEMWNMNFLGDVHMYEVDGRKLMKGEMEGTSYNHLDYYNCKFSTLSFSSIGGGNGATFSFGKVTADFIAFNNMYDVNFDLSDSEVNSLYVRVFDGHRFLNIQNNTIGSIAVTYSPKISASITGNTFLLSKDSTNEYTKRYILNLNSEVINFNENIFLEDDYPISLKAETEELTISKNTFSGKVDFSESGAAKEFTLVDNDFKEALSLNKFRFSEVYNEVNWTDLSKKITSIEIHDTQEDPNSPDSLVFKSYWNGQDVGDNKYLDYLIRDYYTIYSIYKQSGNIRFANSAYSEMKDLENLRLGSIYRKEGGLRNWFKLQLGKLLKFYTDNGTNPAKAMVISLYIIIAFAFFYLFFPSEWDVTSKSKVIGELKMAFTKKETGTIRSVFKSSIFLLFSFINALTLSLNSFVTLGFGKIPTYGIARYVCIIEGFLGWFLLSIFSVALINQVLF